MVVKVLGILMVVFAIITTGCGLAIHKKWVGEMEATAHIVLGSMLVFLLAEITRVFTLI